MLFHYKSIAVGFGGALCVFAADCDARRHAFAIALVIFALFCHAVDAAKCIPRAGVFKHFRLSPLLFATMVTHVIVEIVLILIVFVVMIVLILVMMLIMHIILLLFLKIVIFVIWPVVLVIHFKYSPQY